METVPRLESLESLLSFMTMVVLVLGVMCLAWSGLMAGKRLWLRSDALNASSDASGNTDAWVEIGMYFYFGIMLIAMVLISRYVKLSDYSLYIEITAIALGLGAVIWALIEAFKISKSDARSDDGSWVGVMVKCTAGACLIGLVMTTELGYDCVFLGPEALKSLKASGAI